MSLRKCIHNVDLPILLLGEVTVWLLTLRRHSTANEDQVVSLITLIRCSCRQPQILQEHMQLAHHVSALDTRRCSFD
jgi:hypothetical protein